MKHTYYWSTEEPHSTNSDTMSDYLANEMDQSWEVLEVNGTYAEIITDCGELYAIQASGDSFNHKIQFYPL